jgi:hypothetical protein
MNQAVITFTNSTARSSAITSPVEGMVTYLADTNTYQFWNGSAWTNLVSSTSGLEHIRTQAFDSVASISLGSDASPIFSSSYDNYRIVFTSGGSTNASRNWSIRMRANTTDNSAASYGHIHQGLEATGGLNNAAGTSQTSSIIMPNAFDGTSRVSTTFDVFHPFLATNTFFTGLSIGINTSSVPIHYSFSAVHAVASSFNGFTVINSSGNFTNGQVSVYGYRKA